MAELKRLLMIAYHFPPLAGSSGIQRTLRFARNLPDFGWQPTVLTAHPRAYVRVSDDQLIDIPESVEVIRAPAWDTSRHFSVVGRYPGLLARPDRWVSWWLGALWKGRSAIKRLQPDALWSTYPIATAHQIGATLSRSSNIPWIADFRDPMAQPGYPADPLTWRSFDRIERAAIAGARFSTLVTPSAVQTYSNRYPQYAKRFRLLENGYDEQTFANLATGIPLNPGRITLLHSGIVYPSERDPTQVFEALVRLRQQSKDLFKRIVIRFRAPVHDDLLRNLCEKHDVGETIEILPPIGYRDALQEMMNADGLLILQAANCNEQIPAKLYEYMRTYRPIIVLSDPKGDTAVAARGAGLSAIAPLNESNAISDLLHRFIQDPKHGTLAKKQTVVSASRLERARQLANLLDEATA